MVIQLQKFNGKNKYNNQVDIDFINKTVKFKPIKGSGSFVTNNHIYPVISNILINLLIYYLLIINIKHLLLNQDVSLDLILLFITYYSLRYFFMLLDVIILSRIKAWDSIFPKINAFLIGLLNILKLKNPYKRLVITKDEIIGNKFILHDFENVWLNYQLEEDFSKKIKSIRIRPKYRYDPYKWKLIVEFKSKPEDGCLKIKFI